MAWGMPCDVWVTCMAVAPNISCTLLAAPPSALLWTLNPRPSGPYSLSRPMDPTPLPRTLTWPGDAPIGVCRSPLYPPARLTRPFPLTLNPSHTHTHTHIGPIPAPAGPDPGPYLLLPSAKLPPPWP